MVKCTMKQCSPDRVCETREYDCPHFQFQCWRFDSKGDSTIGYCEKLEKKVQYYFNEEAPCEPKQIKLM